MATYNLVNSVQVGTNKIYAGTPIDSTVDDVTGIQAAGGVLETTSNTQVATAAALCQQLRLEGATEERVNAIMTAALAQSGGTGAQGAQGAAGAQGAQGAAGAQGAQGAAGAQGAQGAQG